MTSAYRQLVPGLQINRSVRRGSLIGGCILAGVSLLFTFGWSLWSGSDEIALIQLIWLGPAAFSASVALIYKEVTVLGDGLEIGSRFVPFESITAVSGGACLSARVDYRYHGADFRVKLVTNIYSRQRLPLLVQELREAAGLSPVEPEIAPASQS